MKRLKKISELIEVYHGTSSDLVDSILATGLKVVVGGDGDGAYVTHDFEVAQCYAVSRAGEKRRYPNDYLEFSEIYPVVLVLKVDDSELKQGFNTDMFAPNGISPDNIIEVKDVSNEEHFQALLESMKLEKNNDSTADEYYLKYMSYVFKYI